MIGRASSLLSLIPADGHATRAWERYRLDQYIPADEDGMHDYVAVEFGFHEDRWELRIRPDNGWTPV